MQQREPLFACKPCLPCRDRFRVPIECEHAAFSTQGLQQECRVTASPERRIDIVAVRLQCQRRERFRGEHRNMLSHDLSGRVRPPAMLFSWAVPNPHPHRAIARTDPRSASTRALATPTPPGAGSLERQ